jgi:hypothetical protein
MRKVLGKENFFDEGMNAVLGNAPGLTHYNFVGFALGSCYPSLLV